MWSCQDLLDYSLSSQAYAHGNSDNKLPQNYIYSFLHPTWFLQAAQQGFTSAAAKYSTARGVLSFLGPAMWVWLGMDLALKAIGPDYARVVKAVSFLAQVRLLHTHGFTNPVRPA